MTTTQRVGQLFMVGVPTSAPAADAEQIVQSRAVGGVLLYGGSHSGVAGVHALTTQLQEIAAPGAGGIHLYVAADQEGGQVQALQGPGFDVIPSAVAQGREDPQTLEHSAEAWGSQLTGAGVNVDLAPVMDVVPASMVATNQPVGRYDRQFGQDPATVSSHGVAVIEGLQSGKVAATMKHFPGLGRVIGNTDVTAGVADTVTTRHDSDLAPYAAGIKAGVKFAMVSLAVYPNIDPSQPAAFSPQVIQGMLRGDLSFTGLVISDDLGFAAQVQSTPPGERAVAFLNAGGDIIIASRPPSVVTSMIDAVISRTTTDPAFRQVVNDAALAVLQSKESAGLLPC